MARTVLKSLLYAVPFAIALALATGCFVLAGDWGYWSDWFTFAFQGMGTLMLAIAGVIAFLALHELADPSSDRS